MIGVLAHMTRPAELVPGSPVDTETSRSLTRWAWVSVTAAILTLVLKFGAYALTGSVGLLSDAVESSVNLVAALTALFALWYAVRPVDRSHNYGHEKIEFFAAAVEGGLILFAAGGIVWYAAQRLIDPQPLASLGLGLAISTVAAVVNLLAARVLLRVAAQHRSVVLEADGQHLMTDVWTSAGVIAGLLLVRLTGQERLDPIIALLIAVNIVRVGVGLLKTAFDGLMDRALTLDEERTARGAIEHELTPGLAYHALRTRRAGTRRFVDLHLLVPGTASVAEAHEVANRVELAVERALPGSETTVHIEPVEDPGAWTDSALLDIEPQSLAFDLPDFLTVDVPATLPAREAGMSGEAAGTQRRTAPEGIEPMPGPPES